MKMTNKIIFCFLVALYLTLQSCQQPGKSTGSEYMPDMAHSVAYEANHYNYYYNNTWGSEADYYKYAKPKLPVKGTVPRTSSDNSVQMTASGSVPYYYGNTEEERVRATAELINNPFPITDAGLAQGKELYDVMCGICHGAKADGLGYLARDESEGGKYPVQPAILTSDEFVAASNGRYYHAIMHGKNLMGAYSDKMGYEERWQVIHYIRSLQAKDRKLKYNQFENTLNLVDQPAGEIVVETHEVHHDEDHDVDHHDVHEGGHDTDHGTGHHEDSHNNGHHGDDHSGH